LIFECPGSKLFKQPEPKDVKCAFCGSEVEIWTDEVKAKCPCCKKYVTGQVTQSCFDWCKHARECAGDEVYNKYLENKNTEG